MVMTWTREQQAMGYEKHAPLALELVLQHLIEHDKAIIALGAERAMGIGYDQYGDASYHLTGAELEQALNEELADAVKYMEIMLTKGEL